MGQTLKYETDASPRAVLDAIQAEVPHWQESIMPDALRRRGLYSVNADITGTTFRLYCPRSRRNWAGRFDVHGSVASLSNGRTSILVTPGLVRSDFWGPAAFLVIGLWTTFSGDS